MKTWHKIGDWLEIRACVPAYSGWVLAAFSICFLGAAINTMAGWLYVISGISFALLAIAATLPVRSLRKLRLKRLPIQPISVGDQLTVEIEIENQSNQPKTLLQFQDMLPFVLGQPVQGIIETLAPQETYRWVYYHPTQRRGFYRWHAIQLRTATPLGLFWCRRNREAAATAVVYPTVLPLTLCPLIDGMGQDNSPQFSSRDRQAQAANENVTRSLRPYRWGDPIRLVHWRTSARYGELRVRELEVFTGGQEVTICLDSSGVWREEDFEQAVIAAASLYFYASRCKLNAKLWTAGTGLLHGNGVVLQALASVNPQEEPGDSGLPNAPVIWLTQNPQTLNSLPIASRWLLWPQVSPTEAKTPISRDFPGILINAEQDLQLQLQSAIR